MAGALREILARFGFEVDSAKLEQANAKVDETKDKMGNLGKLIAGGIIYSGLKSFVNELRDTGSELRNTSMKLGLNTQEWQRWSYVAGGASEELATGIRFLQKNAVEAAEKGGEAGQVFGKLGVQVKDVSGHVRDTGALLRDTGFAIAGIKNPAERTAAAMKVFGRAGTALLPIFAKGRDGVAALMQEFDELGGGLSNEALDVLKESGKASKRFDTAILGLKSRLAVELFPVLTQLVGYGVKGVVWFQKLTAHTNFFKAAMVVLGAVAAKAALAMLAPWLPAIAIIGSVILLVDDLITAFRGGDSATGRLIDKLFGKGTTKSIFSNASKDLDEFLELTKGASTFDQVIAVYQAAFTGLAEDIPKWFGQANNAVKDWTDANIVAPIASLVSRIGSKVSQIGSDIVDGFVDGMKAAWGKVEAFWEASGGALIKKIRSIYDSHSPARKLIPIGFSLPEGQAEGMAKGLHLVEKQRDAMGAAGMPEPDASAPKYVNPYAPIVPRASSRRQTNHVQQHNRIEQNFHGVEGQREALTAMRGGAASVLQDDRRAMMADLEVLGGDDGD
jgi:hypothetical protein